MAFGYREATAEEQLAITKAFVPGEGLLPDQQLFINAYLKVGTINGAAKRSKINKFYHYSWLKEYPEYQAAFIQAESVILDDDIANIRSRGIDGFDYEVLDKDGEVRKLRRFSDNLAMFYIKAKDQRFKDNHKGDTTININGSDAKVQFNFDQFRELLK